MLLKRPALEAVQSRIRGARPPPGTPAWPGPARPHESHNLNRAGQWLQGDVMPISQGSRAQAPRDEDKPVTLWLGGTRGPPCTVKQVRRSRAQSAVCGAHRHTAFLLSGEAPRQQSCRSTANQGTARTAAEPQQEARTDGGAPTPRAARSLSAEPARRARGPRRHSRPSTPSPRSGRAAGSRLCPASRTWFTQERGFGCARITCTGSREQRQGGAWARATRMDRGCCPGWAAREHGGRSLRSGYLAPHTAIPRRSLIPE